MYAQRYGTYLFFVFYAASLIGMDSGGMEIEQGEPERCGIMVHHDFHLHTLPNNNGFTRLWTLHSVWKDRRDQEAFDMFIQLQSQDMFFEHNLLPYIGDQDMGNLKAITTNSCKMIQKVQDTRKKCLEGFEEETKYKANKNLLSDSIVMNPQCSTIYFLGHKHWLFDPSNEDGYDTKDNFGIMTYKGSDLSFTPIDDSVSEEAEDLFTWAGTKSIGTPNKLGSVVRLKQTLLFLDKTGRVKHISDNAFRHTALHFKETILHKKKPGLAFKIYPDAYITSTMAVTTLISGNMLRLYDLNKCMPKFCNELLQTKPTAIQEDSYNDEQGICSVAKKITFNSLPEKWEPAIQSLQQLWALDQESVDYSAMSLENKCKLHKVILMTKEQNKLRNSDNWIYDIQDAVVKSSPCAFSFPLVDARGIVYKYKISRLPMMSILQKS